MSRIQSYYGGIGSCHAVVSQVVSSRLLLPRLRYVTVCALVCAVAIHSVPALSTADVTTLPTTPSQPPSLAPPSPPPSPELLTILVRHTVEPLCHDPCPLLYSSAIL